MQTDIGLGTEMKLEETDGVRLLGEMERKSERVGNQVGLSPPVLLCQTLALEPRGQAGQLAVSYFPESS